MKPDDWTPERIAKLRVILANAGDDLISQEVAWCDAFDFLPSALEEIERLRAELDAERILSEHRKTVSEKAQQNWFDSEEEVELLRVALRMIRDKAHVVDEICKGRGPLGMTTDGGPLELIFPREVARMAMDGTSPAPERKVSRNDS